MTTDTATRPAATELEQFYADIIITAVEGGDARFARLETWGEHIWGHAHTTIATVVSIDVDGDDGSDLLPEGVTLPVAIGTGQIAHAFTLMANALGRGDCVEAVGIHEVNVGRFMGARGERDAGDIDAYDAAAIFQVALFGKAHLG